MGLLDEAIRQHLELKRQHGASDEELQMQEQEALGPVRREPVEGPPEVAEAAESPPEPATEDDLEHAYGASEGEPGADAPLYEETPAEDVAAQNLDEPLPTEFHEPIDPYSDPEAAAVDAPRESIPDEERLHAIASDDTPSGGFQAVPDPATPLEQAEQGLEEDDEGLAEDDERLEEDDQGEEDVLEETPEFLQETPEHDRLWFEQKPPRDFDFDE